MKRYLYLMTVFCFSITLVVGCGKDGDRYTYRDAGIESLNSGDYEGAITSFDQAIKTSNGVVRKFDIDVLKYRGEAEYGAADYQAAANTYDILIQVDKELPEYLNMRCIARAKSGDLEGALEDYRRSAELDKEKIAKGRTEALLAVGAVMESRGDLKDAMVLYEEARGEGLESAQLYNRIGLCKIGDKDYAAAIKYFEQGSAAPDSTAVPELLYNQAVAYEYTGDFAKALELMQQYVSANVSDKEAARELDFLKTRQ